MPHSTTANCVCLTTSVCLALIALVTAKTSHCYVVDKTVNWRRMVRYLDFCISGVPQPIHMSWTAAEGNSLIRLYLAELSWGWLWPDDVDLQHRAACCLAGRHSPAGAMAPCNEPSTCSPHLGWTLLQRQRRPNLNPSIHFLYIFCFIHTWVVGTKFKRGYCQFFLLFVWPNWVRLPHQLLKTRQKQEQKHQIQ